MPEGSVDQDAESQRLPLGATIPVRRHRNPSHVHSNQSTIARVLTALVLSLTVLLRKYSNGVVSSVVRLSCAAACCGNGRNASCGSLTVRLRRDRQYPVLLHRRTDV